MEDQVTISGCTAIAETDKALLITYSDGEDFWVPKSQITQDSEVYEKDGVGDLIVTAWWAKKTGKGGY